MNIRTNTSFKELKGNTREKIYRENWKEGERGKKRVREREG